MANADDFDRFVGHAIKNSIWVPNQRGGAKSGSLLSQRSAFRPLAQARDYGLDASFKWTNERWEIGLEIVENVIEVFERGLRKDHPHDDRRYFAKTASTCSSVANRPSAAS